MKRVARMTALLLGLILGATHSTAAETETETEGGNGIRFHGYGELHYNNPEGSDVPDPNDPAIMDMHRLVLGWSYVFNDRIRLHSEIDFEHAATELELEFAFLEFDLAEGVQARVGSLLMPVGDLNEFHEPTLFYSVERPYIQSRIIPTTWQEGGAGLAVDLAGFRGRLYLVNGLDATGFSAGGGIRGGRQKVAEAKAEDLAVVARLELVGVPGVRVGGSFYQGGADQDPEGDLDVDVTLWDLDATARFGAFEARGIYVMATIDGTDDLNALLSGGDPDFDPVGEELAGWMAELAVHVLPLLMETEQDVVIFVRMEEFNTQEEVALGDPNDANDRQVLTFGAAYYPHPNVVLKVDHERWENEADADESRTNFGMAYMY